MNEQDKTQWPFSEIPEGEEFDIDAVFGSSTSADVANPFTAPIEQPEPPKQPEPIKQPVFDIPQPTPPVQPATADVTLYANFP